MGDFLQEAPIAGPSGVNRKKLKKKRPKKITACNDNTCCDRKDKYQLDKLNISFAGCGFLGIYHMGVITAFQHFAKEFQFNSVCGASAGAIAGVALIGEVPINKMVNTLMTTVTEARRYTFGALNPQYNITDVLRETLHDILPEDIHLKANGKLFISCTKVNEGSNVLVDNYSSKSELIDCVIASAFIPGFSGTIPPAYRGVKVIDGGFTCNMPRFNENTITVNPFAGNAIICPLDEAKVRSHEVHRVFFSDQGTDLTVANLTRLLHVIFPPTATDLAEILMEGFKDGHRFLRLHNFIDCSQCLEVKANVKPCVDDTNCDVPLTHFDLPDKVQTVINTFTDAYERSIKQSPMMQMLSQGYYYATYLPPVYFFDLSMKCAANSSKSFFNKVYEIIKYLDEIPNQSVRHKLEGLFSTFVRSFMEDHRDDKKKHTDCDDEQHLGSDDEEDEIHDCYQDHEIEHHDDEEEEQEKEAMGMMNVDINVTALGHGPQQYERMDDSSEDNSDDGEQVQRAGAPIGDEGDSEEDEEDGLPFLSFKFSSDQAIPMPSMPENNAEAQAIQSDNLLAALQTGQPAMATNMSRRGSSALSRATSRRNSVSSTRQPSLAGSRRNSLHGSRESLFNSAASMASGAASMPGNETLENIRRVTESHESVLGYSYRNDSGELVLVNIYDISDTDPVEIIGDDILLAEEEEEEDEDNDLDLDLDLHQRLQSVPMERFMASKTEDDPAKEQTEDDLAKGQTGAENPSRSNDSSASEDLSIDNSQDSPPSDPESDWDHRFYNQDENSDSSTSSANTHKTA